MNVPNTRLILAAITPIVEVFEQLGINYHIGGLLPVPYMA